jgi:hypothetical protein
MAWGRSAANHSQADKPGYEFAGLACRKLYYWSAASTPSATKRFIESLSIPNKRFAGASHWPMIENPRQCGTDILEFFLGYD